MRTRSPIAASACASQLVPHRLAQRRTGEHERLAALEQRVAQLRVGVHRAGDLLEALGHVEVHRRRDLAQVAQRLGDAARAWACRRRCTACRRCRARCRRCGCRRRCGSTAASRPAPAAPRPGTRRHWRSICWLAHSMRWVLITPLGCLVEPEVNRNLAIVSGPTAACAASSAAAWAWSRAGSSKRRTARPSSVPCGQHDRHVGRDGGRDRLRIGRRRWRTPAPASRCRGCGAACRSPATPANTPSTPARTARRPTSRPAPSVQVLEVVVRQDRERPLDRQAEVQQRLADGAARAAASARS